MITYAILLVFVLPLFAQEGRTGTKATPLSSRLWEIREKYEIIGMSVVAVKDDQIIYSEAFGHMDPNRRKPATPATIYRIASISKTVAAAVLLQLHEQGKFDLDDDISDVLGYAVRNPKHPDVPITYKQLLTHTSSLTDGGRYGTYLMAAYREKEPPSIREILLPGGRFFSDSTFADYAPGSGQFTYCNLGFGLVGTLVEILSGERFDIYCREHIFKPMGLKASFNVADIDVNALTPLYRKVEGEWRAQADSFGGVQPIQRDLSSYVIGSNGSLYGPQGGLRISVEELGQFMLMILQGGAYRNVQILRAETVEKMLDLHWEGTGYEGFYRRKGLAVQRTIDLYPGIELFGHGGDAYGLLSAMYFSPEHRLGIAFAMNGGRQEKGKGVFSAFEEDVARILFEELFNPLSEIPALPR